MKACEKSSYYSLSDCALVCNCHEIFTRARLACLEEAKGEVLWAEMLHSPPAEVHLQF